MLGAGYNDKFSRLILPGNPASNAHTLILYCNIVDVQLKFTQQTLDKSSKYLFQVLFRDLQIPRRTVSKDYVFLLSR